MLEVTLLTGAGLGFLLGFQHTFDADHIVAVTTIVSRSHSLLRSALVGLVWGIGHSLTLFAVGFGVLIFKLTIPDKLALSLEFVVGIVLVLLGISVLRKLTVGGVHIHWHQHEDKEHLHSHSHEETPGHDHEHIRRPLLVGMLHGLAGSGALVPLVLSTMPSVAQGLIFLLLFGLGSILSMLLFGGFISLPFQLTAQFSQRLNRWVQGVAGVISLALGIFVMWQVGFAGGFFPGFTTGD